jgi:Flp pilus assembly protein protease CpaA
MIENYILLGSSIALLHIARTDIQRYHIGNIPLIILFVLGWLYRILNNGDLIDGILGMLFGLGVGLILFTLGGMGGGDGKLMAALGVWLGWHGLYLVILAASCAGAAWGIIKLYRSGQLKERLTRFLINAKLRFIYGVKGTFEFEKLDDTSTIPKSMVPFGTCLAVATIVLFLTGRLDIFVAY